MSIKINIQKNLRCYTNEKPFFSVVNGRTVEECLQRLESEFPKITNISTDPNRRWTDYIEIFVNQQSAYPDELQKTVQDGDEIDIMFMFAGG